MLQWLFNTQQHASGLSAKLLRLITLIILLALLYQAWLFLHICWWVPFNPATTALMQTRVAEKEKLQLQVNPNSAVLQGIVAQKDRLFALVQSETQQAAKQKTKQKIVNQYQLSTFKNLKHQWVDYDNISNHLKRAVIASEDATFMEHNGFDWQGIQKAYEKNIKKGKIVAGGSTISQQLAKNLFLSSQRSPWRKAQEVVVTVMIETVMTKRRILETYLNMIEWGNGIFGADAAAAHYYRNSANKLSRHQAAKLAAMIPNPRFYDTHQSTRFLNRHAGTIQARMHMVVIPK